MNVQCASLLSPVPGEGTSYRSLVSPRIEEQRVYAERCARFEGLGGGLRAPGEGAGRAIRTHRVSAWRNADERVRAGAVREHALQDVAASSKLELGAGDRRIQRSNEPLQGSCRRRPRQKYADRMPSDPGRAFDGLD